MDYLLNLIEIILNAKKLRIGNLILQILNQNSKCGW
ncbi:hypothetical protein CoNPh17_CDS0148 [Staphylococcus phage S-CoN_Ph17]|nr:hypothetical protein CoNPh17_CDS0148 [Staphylococcus phage S-CoN_Ph17]